MRGAEFGVSECRVWGFRVQGAERFWVQGAGRREGVERVQRGSSEGLEREREFGAEGFGQGSTPLRSYFFRGGELRKVMRRIG